MSPIQVLLTAPEREAAAPRPSGRDEREPFAAQDGRRRVVGEPAREAGIAERRGDAAKAAPATGRLVGVARDEVDEAELEQLPGGLPRGSSEAPVEGGRRHLDERTALD